MKHNLKTKSAERETSGSTYREEKNEDFCTALRAKRVQKKMKKKSMGWQKGNHSQPRSRKIYWKGDVINLESLECMG